MFACVLVDMEIQTDLQSKLDATGLFEARYVAFLETITHLRPRLHRYCARMTGSVLDGEDVMQEAVFEAYRKLDTFDDSRALNPWLFRIVHNRCIDFLRRRQVREEAEAAAVGPEAVLPVETPGREIDRAVERLVVNLPPKERACVLLKDVFEYSLDEIADLVDSTVGGVKAALNRGRAKLTTLPRRPTASLRRARRLWRCSACMLIGSIAVTGMACVNSRAQTRACEWPTVSQAASPTHPTLSNMSVPYPLANGSWRSGRRDGCRDLA